jgi:outer membrane lipoprotein-sorting protein
MVRAQMVNKFTLILILALMPWVWVPAQSLTDILSRHQAASGFSARQKVRTLTSIGKVTQMGNTLPISIIQKRPNKYRFDVHLDEGRITQAYDGNFGWSYNPFTGVDTLPLDGQELAQIRESADFDGMLYTYRQKGFTAQLLGKVPLGTRSAWKIQIRKPSGEIMNFFIDTVTYLVVKSDVEFIINKMPYVAESVFLDFRKVGGMVLPYLVQTRNGAMLTETRIDTVRLNETMEDYYFQWKRQR